MKKFCFIALAAIMTFVGCDKNSALYYGISDMGQVTNGNIVTDGGLTYIVTENESGSTDYKSLDRIVFLCDVLEKLEGDNTYSIRLQNYSSVLVSEPVNKTAQSEEWFGDDAIRMQSGWFSGGYLNMYVTMTMIQNSTTSHQIRLMFDDTVDNSDTLHFYLKHNGNGETYEADPTNSKIVEAAGYVSFPIDSYVPTGKNGINIRIDWDWYKSMDDRYSTEKEHYSETGYYERSSGGAKAASTRSADASSAFSGKAVSSLGSVAGYTVPIE
jgi:hypothetical protein